MLVHIPLPEGGQSAHSLLLPMGEMAGFADKRCSDTPQALRPHSAEDFSSTEAPFSRRLLKHRGPIQQKTSQALRPHSAEDTSSTEAPFSRRHLKHRGPIQQKTSQAPRPHSAEDTSSTEAPFSRRHLKQALASLNAWSLSALALPPLHLLITPHPHSHTATC